MSTIDFKSFVSRSGVDYKEHQERGVDWCMRNELRETPEVHGGFIADEMGLGKTIMMLGLVVCNFQNGFKRTLVVLPNVLLHQWSAEILRSCGHRVLVYHGSKKKKITREMLERAPIVLTTYSAMAVPFIKTKSTDTGKDTVVGGLLHAVSWDRVIFDEAHHLRNKNSRFYGAKLLPSRSKWFISGTPIQNRKRDFTNLCSILGLPVSFLVDEANSEELFREFVLRRTKADVGISFTRLSLEQKDVTWDNPREKMISQHVHNSMDLSDAKSKLSFILFARQSCILSQMLREKLDLSCHDAGSSKLTAVLNSLSLNRANGNGKLVFCHFHQEIDFVLSQLRERGFHRIASFDGRMTQTQKNKVLSLDLEVLVLQIQTGCEGLNLQHKYSEIYFVSPHWNPSVEDQAVARCHRIGQLKDVQVYKYCMNPIHDNQPDNQPDNQRESIERYIFNKQNEKKDVSNEIFYSHTL